MGFPEAFQPDRGGGVPVVSWRGQLARLPFHEYHTATALLTLEETLRVVGLRTVVGWLDEIEQGLEKIKKDLLKRA